MIKKKKSPTFFIYNLIDKFYPSVDGIANLNDTPMYDKKSKAILLKM